MSDFFTDEKIKLFRRKIFILLNYTIPGIVLLEIYFARGFFSIFPENLYSFLIYILWAFLFSIPFNLLNLVNVEKIVLKHAKAYTLEKGGNINDIKKLDDLSESNQDYYEEINSKVHHIGILVNSLLIYIADRILNYHYEYYSIWGVDKKTIIIFNVLVILLFTSYLLSNIAAKIISTIVKTYFNRL